MFILFTFHVESVSVFMTPKCRFHSYLVPTGHYSPQLNRKLNISFLRFPSSMFSQYFIAPIKIPPSIRPLVSLAVPPRTSCEPLNGIS
jgi:hypothetical protein